MALADFAHVHPELELDVTVADGDAMRDAYRAGKLDLVLSDSLLVGQPPRKRRSCPLVWAAASAFDPAARDPVPLVLFRHPCEWRVRTVQALERSGRRWRAAFESGSLIAIQAAVRAGVGIATLLPGNIEAGIVVLDRAPAVCRRRRVSSWRSTVARRCGRSGQRLWRTAVEGGGGSIAWRGGRHLGRHAVLIGAAASLTRSTDPVGCRALSAR
jgi:DNA-binding transcriptional LysR family regulator